MKPLIASILCLAAVSAQADEILFQTLSIHSKHSWDQNAVSIDSNGFYHYYTKHVAYNDVNEGIGYRWGDKDSWSIGVYHNSYYRPTFYAVREWMPTEHFGLAGGLATGYAQELGHNVIFIGGIEYRQKITENWTANVIGFPPFGKMAGVANLTLSRQFNGLGK